jgi:hypothetical protein
MASGAQIFALKKNEKEVPSGEWLCHQWLHLLMKLLHAFPLHFTRFSPAFESKHPQCRFALRIRRRVS